MKQECILQWIETPNIEGKIEMSLYIGDITTPGDYRDKELEKFDITDDEITRAFKKLHNEK